jgi:hypothetical protein
MNPINGERGKTYYGVKCQNRQCRRDLLLVEIPVQTAWHKLQVLRKPLHDLRVRCPVCTQETPVLERQLLVLAV